MVIRSRLRATIFPLILYCVSASVGGYFVWHAVNGQRGLKAKTEYKRQMTELRSELDGLKKDRKAWQHRVELVHGDVIDRDLLDEETRKLLGRVTKQELVILLPNADKR
jgi:cell division protein FtsB